MLCTPVHVQREEDYTILTKNALFRSHSTFVYLLHAHILNINMCTYITSTHGHELSGYVRADA